MRVMKKLAVSSLSAAALVALSAPALATNGYFTHGVGTESKGMAGSGVGSNAARGGIIVASNPALGVFAGDNWELGLSFFSPLRSYTAEGGFQGNFGAFSTETGKFDSSSEWFPIPYIAKNWRLGEDKALTVAFFGRGGMNTDWDSSTQGAYFDPTGQGGQPGRFAGTFGGEFVGPPQFVDSTKANAGVDLSQAFLTVNYAGKAGNNFAWGIGPVFALQMFEATGLSAFFPYTATFNECVFGQPPGSCNPMPTSLTNNGHDSSTGIGANVGVWWKMGPVGAGLSYTSQISMSELDDYADLFAEDGGFDIPASIKFGLSFEGTNNVRVNLDVEQIQYSEVGSVGNPMSNILNCPIVAFNFGLPADPEACLGGASGAGFGWDDMTAYKLGFEWMRNDSVWRFGYSYGEQPIQEADVLFNILAPGVMEQHITFGLTKGGWNYSLMYAPTKKVKGLNLFDPGQTIEVEMKQFEFEFSYSF